MATLKKFTGSGSSFLILLAAFLCGTLTSPRHSMSLFAWPGIFLWLLYSRNSTIKGKWIWMGLGLYVSSFIANNEVFPMPVIIMGVILLIGMLKLVLIYWFENRLYRKGSGFIRTLMFPCLMVANEYLDAQGGGGVWGSVANTQFDFPWLMQLASITGIWGITFLICWTASVIEWVIQHRKETPYTQRGFYLFAAIFLVIIGYGAYQFESRPARKNHSLVVGGLTMPTFSLLESVYEDVTGKPIKIPWTIAQSSPQLQLVNEALKQFVENPDSIKFPLAYRQLSLLHDSLFLLTAKLARKGAALITWSEGNGFLLKNQEESFRNRGRMVARENKIYLLMPMAVIHPGKLTAGKKFIENKTLFIGPDGNLLNEFFKNRPVPMVESSEAGDQQVPVIQTRFGLVSPSICYDADFPALMRQTGKKGTDLLLLPSGDWYAISPYHSYMARYRAIENGITVVRQVNGGLSMVCDSRGRVLHSLDFYKPGEKAWVAKVDIGHEKTIYQWLGDWLAWACSLVSLAVLAGMISRWIIIKVKLYRTRSIQG